MQKNNIPSLIKPNIIVSAITKERKNDTCDMEAYYYQVEKNTLAYAVLMGAHGERKDIPALRRYYICSGLSIFLINGKEYEASSGSIVEIPAHSTYDFHSVGSEPICFFVDIGFPIDLDTIPSK